MKVGHSSVKLFKSIHYELMLLEKLTSLSEMWTILHPKEIQHINNATNESFRQQRANAYALLKFDQTHWVDYSKEGAPILMIDTMPSEFSISISHKENCVAAATSLNYSKKIGIDLEILNSGRDFSFLKGAFIDERECSYFKSITDLYKLSANDAPLFFWTLKEAAFKALGGSFSIDSFKVSVADGRIKLTCSKTDLPFISDIIMSDENLIALVMVTL